MRVLWFGSYSTGPGYPRTPVLINALRAVGSEVRECHAPLFRGAADKVAAAGGMRGALRMAPRLLRAWPRLASGYLAARPCDLVVVGYTGHLDLLLARALSVLRRRPLVLDAFLSPYDTVVNDRKLLDARSPAARGLFALERTALRLADLVLTDTRASASDMARRFGVPSGRFVPVPVGSLVRARAPARRPVRVAAGGPQAAPRPFTAFFCGSFVPLQGVSYILEAAARAPDLRFEIVGDGPDAGRIEEEVRARRMDNLAFERRFVPRSELERRLAGADAVLGVFGRTGKASRVIPCKVYDGLAAGLPVVTGDGEGPRELLRHGENALLVDREDPRSLVAALRRLRDESDLAGRLRRGARHTAATVFSPRAIGLRLRGALGRLVRK